MPGLWWAGAALLVAGSVIIGRREEGGKVAVEATTGPVEPLLDERQGEGGDPFRDEDDEDTAARSEHELDSVKDFEIEDEEEGRKKMTGAQDEEDGKSLDIPVQAHARDSAA
jgi:hypothetical protein